MKRLAALVEPISGTPKDSLQASRPLGQIRRKCLVHSDGLSRNVYPAMPLCPNSPAIQPNVSSVNRGVTSSIVTLGTSVAGSTDVSKGSSSQAPVMPANGYKAILVNLLSVMPGFSES